MADKPKKFALDPNQRYHYDVWAETDGEVLHVAPTRTENAAGAIADALAAVDYLLGDKSGSKYIVRARATAEHTVYRANANSVRDFIKSRDEERDLEIEGYVWEAEQGFDPDELLDRRAEANELVERVIGGYEGCDDPNCACRTQPVQQGIGKPRYPAERVSRGEELSRDTPEMIAAKRALRAEKKRKKESRAN